LFSSSLSPFSDYRFGIRHLELCLLLVLSRRDSVEIWMNIFGTFSVLEDRKNQEDRVSPVVYDLEISCFALLFCEFLGRFLWLEQIRHSGHLGIKMWMNNTIPQVWVMNRGASRGSVWLS